MSPRFNIPFLFASIGSLVPGISGIFDLYPPLLVEITFVATGLCVLFLIRAQRKAMSEKMLERNGTWLIIVSVSLLIAYVLIREKTTFTHDDRYVQVGYGLADWSLTTEGREVKADVVCRLKLDLQEFFICSGESDEKMIWNNWARISIGILLIIAFLISSILWTVGWVYISRLPMKAPLDPPSLPDKI